MYAASGTDNARAQLALHPAVGQFLLGQASSDNNTSGLDAFADVLKSDVSRGLGVEVRNGSFLLPVSGEHGDRWDRYNEEHLAQIIHKLRIIVTANVPVTGVCAEQRCFLSSENRVDVIHGPAKLAFDVSRETPRSFYMNEPPVIGSGPASTRCSPR